jgi:hypothetical protein
MSFTNILHFDHEYHGGAKWGLGTAYVSGSPELSPSGYHV